MSQLKQELPKAVSSLLNTDVSNWDNFSKIQQDKILRQYTNRLDLDRMLDMLIEEQSKHTFTTDTDQGRKAIISHAAVVTRSKAPLVKFGTVLIGKLEESIATPIKDIKNTQTYIATKLKQAAITIRTPVTEFEDREKIAEAERQRVIAEKERADQEEKDRLFKEQQVKIQQQQAELDQMRRKLQNSPTGDGDDNQQRYTSPSENVPNPNLESNVNSTESNSDSTLNPELDSNFPKLIQALMNNNMNRQQATFIANLIQSNSLPGVIYVPGLPTDTINKINTILGV